MKSALMIIVVGAFACGGKSDAPAETTPTPPVEQDFAVGMRVVCASPTSCKAEVEAIAEPAEKASTFATCIDKQVTNEEVRTWFKSRGTVEDDAKRDADFKAALAKANIAEADCELAAFWAPTPAPQ